MPRQTPEQFAQFQALCRANQLDPKADVWQQKQSGQWIIGRTGIEKIQARNNIAVALAVVGFAIDYAGVKATATRTVKEEGARTAKKLVVESLGSAHPKNCTQISYYLEMAEKRAKSRAILMLMGFYELGIYGEDEADAFQRQADSISGDAVAVATPAQPVGNAAGGSVTASEPPVMRAERNSAAPVGSAGADPNTLAAQAKEAMLAAVEQATSTIELKKLFEGIHPAEQETWKPVFTAARARVQAAIAEAAATPVRPQPATPAPASPVRETGTDSALVDEFLTQPTLANVAFTPATAEQKETIIRLLNLNQITRKEKTALLVGLPKLDTERARQAIVKLRATIEQREGSNQEKELRQALHGKATSYPEQLGPERVAEFLALVEDGTASVEALRAALAEANDCLNNNDHGYGTDEELAAADAIAA